MIQHNERPTITGKVIEVTSTGYAKRTIRLDTQPDFPIKLVDRAQLAFAIGNPEFWEREHTFALTPGGRISHVIS